jgi:hypothetical protein
VRLQSYHEGTAQVKTRLYETYKREYENFTQLDGESIDAMFSRFSDHRQQDASKQGIVTL